MYENHFVGPFMSRILAPIMAMLGKRVPDSSRPAEFYSKEFKFGTFLLFTVFLEQILKLPEQVILHILQNR